MADDSAPQKRRRPRKDTVQKFRSELQALSKRFERARGKPAPLTWDTQLLVKKTQAFKADKFISTKDPDWKEIVAEIEINHKGICISDVRNVDAIEFIASFAAQRQLKMTYGDGSFLLEPRNLDD